MVWGKVEDPDSSEAYSEDDGLFDKGERAQKHYDEMFSPKEAAQKKPLTLLGMPTMKPHLAQIDKPAAEQTLSVLKRIEKRRVLSLLLRIM